MIISSSTTFVSAFLASFVEAVEALTIVLAAGSSRGWKPALTGAGSALFVLILVTAFGGPFLQHFPVQMLRLALGLFLLFLGLRWLRKAVLRAAGVLPQKDEALVFDRTEQQLRSHEVNALWFDCECFSTSFAAVFIEGVEVIFIVLSLGAAGNTLIFASSGAAFACLCVIGLGLLLHRPLTSIPENWFKFSVGILLTACGLFWGAEGLGLTWPGGDTAFPALLIATSTLAFLAIWVLRRNIRFRN